MRREDRTAVTALAGLTALLFSPFLLSWPTPLIYPNSSLGTDLPREIWPLADFVKRTLLTTGEIPLWRPYLLSGAPLVGHPVAPLFYPVHWLSLALPLGLAFCLDIAIHFFWMGLGTYTYLRVNTRTRWEAALVGALIFSQAPMWIAHIGGGHLPMVAAIAWWPWIWLACGRFSTTARGRWAVIAGIGLAAQLMNHGMFAGLSVLVMAALSVARVVRHRLAALKGLLLGWVLALGVAFTLSAIQLLPFLELVRHSTRATITFEEAAFGSLPPALLLGTFFPSELKFPEWLLYPGVGALVLAVYALGARPSKREMTAALAVLIGVVLSLGENTPIYRIMYAAVPAYSVLRVPARWWLFSLFGLDLLAAWGLDKWLSGMRPQNALFRSLSGGLVVFYGVAALLKLIRGSGFPFDVLPTAVSMLLLLLILHGNASRRRLGILIAVVIIDCWWTAWGLIRPQPERTIVSSGPIISLLREAARDGARSFAPFGGLEMSQMETFGLRGADGYDSFTLEWYSRLGQSASGCDYRGYSASVPSTASSPAAVRACPEFDPNSHLLALLNVRYIVLPAPMDFPEGSLVLAHDGLWVYEIAPGLGRAFGVSEGSVVASEQCISTLLRTDVATHVILEEGSSFATLGPPPSVVMRTETPNGEEFVVDVAAPGILVRSETWAPGWTVSVDGRAAKVLRANCALQGVWLEPGARMVTFAYAPESYSVGRWISLIASGLLLTGIAVRKLPLRKKHSSGRVTGS